MEMLWVGVLINTVLFSYMAFTNDKTGIPHKLPNFLLSPILSTVLTLGYFASFLIIILSPGGLIRNIIIVLLMQFLINHILWGIIVGTIGGLLAKKR
jgi:hypothetical protein